TLTGDSEFALRYPSALFGVLAVPLGYALARQLGLRARYGLVLGVLLATSPYLVWYGQEAKMYTMLLVLITLGLIAYLKALTDTPFVIRGVKAGWWIVFVLATSLSFYTHILSPLIIPVYGIIGLLLFEQVRAHWRAWLISLGCITLPYVPLAAWQTPLLLNGFQSGHTFYPLQEQTFLLLRLYSTGLVQFGNVNALILFVFLFLCGLFLAQRVSSITYIQRLILVTWAILPPLFVYLISLRVPVFEDRYLIFITPAFYLLVTAGVIVIRHYSRLLAALCLGLVLIINLVGVWQQQRQPLKAEFRAVAGYLAQQPQSPAHIIVQAPYLHYTLNYYYPDDYTLLEGLWTNGGLTGTQVDEEMRRLTAGLPEVWLVVSEEDIWDRRHLTRTWLDQNATLVDEAHFVRADVYRYKFESDAH
ncbi:MAG: glycosyltransferase family 39 protein, partial [Anaerolineae bacterium]|nr:glycosyltransferase family 39 protein [Anaerolineae bacterium]